MADIVAESRASTKDYSIPHGLLNDTVAQAGKRVQKAALEISERSAKVLQEHPVGITSAATSALCLAGLCLKTPEIREVAKDVAEIVSTRAVVGIDNALMASRKTVRFPLLTVGSADWLELDQPVTSELSQVYLRARKSVAQVQVRRVLDGELKLNTATAFAVSEDGKFVTNCHVAFGDVPHDLRLVDRFGKSHRADVLTIDRNNDLAVLQLRNLTAHKRFTPLGFATRSVTPGHSFTPGENMYCFGHPAGSTRLTGSIKANIREQWPNREYIEEHGDAILTIHGKPGNSGAPILNAKAEVMGIVKSGPDQYSSHKDIFSVACPSDKAKNLLLSRPQLEGKYDSHGASLWPS